MLVQQHLVHWCTLPDVRLTLYEANTAVAYSLIRSGKYIKVAETQAGEFAGKVISNLLFLGYARVGDLVQAYGIGQAKNSGPLLNVSGHADGLSAEQSTASDLMYGTLYDLLRIKLVSRVHLSHFRSDIDNRSEAEKVVPEPEVYRAKNRREQEAQHEAAIKRKLHEWRYHNDGEEDRVEDLKKGGKRHYQGTTTRRPEKRQRLHSRSIQDVASITREEYQPMLGETVYLDVRSDDSLQKGPNH